METGGCDVSGVLLPNQESSFKVSGRKLSRRRLDRDGILEGCLLNQNPCEIYETTLKQDRKCTCNITKRPFLNLATWILLGWSYRFTTGVIILVAAEKISVWLKSGKNIRKFA
jgi:hypothetical protein